MKLTGDRCRCAHCNEFFNSQTAFEKHRIARQCRTPGQMKALGMTVNASGFWITKPNPILRVTGGEISRDQS